MNDDLDDELARLAAATSGLRPAAGFEERVMASLPRAPRWDDSVVRVGRTMLVVAALSAVASVALGVVSDREEQQAAATTYGLEELDF